MADIIFDMEATCAHIKELCEIRNITPTELSERLGVSKQAVYSWFGAKKIPSLDHLIEIAGMLDVKTDDIIMTKRLSNKNE